MLLLLAAFGQTEKVSSCSAFGLCFLHLIKNKVYTYSLLQGTVHNKFTEHLFKHMYSSSTSSYIVSAGFNELRHFKTC